MLSPIKTTVVSHQSGTVRLQIHIDISGSLLDVEERIQDAVNDVGRTATRLAYAHFGLPMAADAPAAAPGEGAAQGDLPLGGGDGT